ncbi:MAG: hypothetical protein HUU20_17370 [Pirellulales bacterium]|nr:hypothetical protein [Pirellulales bacterium]
MQPTFSLIIFALLLPTTQASADVVFREDFERPASPWRSYYDDPPQAKIEFVAGDAADGKHFLRIECPGKRRLEGASTTVGKLEPLSLYTVRAKVRGRGNLFACLLSGNGWLYARDVVALTGAWQEISLPKLTSPTDRSLSIYFITRDAEEATFEVDSLDVVRQPDPPAEDIAAEPVRSEAEDLAPRADAVVNEPSTCGGKAVLVPSGHALAGLAFPVSARPGFLYLRLKPGTPEDVFDLYARTGDYLHKLATAKPAGASGWQWLRMEVPRAAAARGLVQVHIAQPAGDPAPATLDSVVVATDGQLTPERLDSLRPRLDRRPLVAAGFCQEPPAIDGKADDACWKHCIPVAEFQIVRQGTVPTQKTVARLCYDDRRLYMTFCCREYVLQPEANQLHAFRRDQTDRDSPVPTDDCVAVVLGPAEDGPCFDLFVNARGTLADARCRRPDLWAGRDASWNGGIQAAGRVDDGFWEVEVSVDFASLETTAPQPGHRWALGLGRIEKNAGETSSWNPVTSGFHEADSLGTLLFLAQTGSAQVSLPETIRGRANAVRAERGAGASPILAQVTVEQPESLPQRLQALIGPGSSAEIRFDPRAEPRLTLGYNLIDAGALRPLYLSPPLRPTVSAADATVRLATEGAYTVFLNGTRVAMGAKADGSRPISVPLSAGVNAFAFQAETGKLAAAIDLPGSRVVSDGCWRYAAGDPKDFVSAALDDSSWAKAAVLGDPTGPATELGTKQIGGDGSGVFRRTVLLEHTYLWPQPDPAQHVPQNAAQHLTFSAAGLEGRRLNGFAMHLAVPPEFEVIGSTGYYGRSRPERPKFVTSGPAHATRDGREMLVYTISATQPLPYRTKVGILELFNVLVRYRGPEKPADEYRFEYWTEAEGGSVSECVQSLPVRVTPALRGKQPKRLVWQLWGSYFSAMDDPAMKEATLATARMTGLNNIVSGELEDTELGAKHGLTNTMGINFEPWSLDRAKYLRENPADALTDLHGKRSTKYVCTTALLDRGWDDVARVLRAKIETERPHVVDWDYESSPLESYLSCFCARCLEAFRSEAGLGREAELTPEMIREGYAGPWTDFMTTRNAEVAERFQKVVREAGAVFSMYSGYQSRDTQDRYGVDWRKIGRRGAADHVGCGYGRSRELIDATIAALNGIPLTIGILMHPYDPNLRQPVLPLSKAHVLRSAADSTGGILVYDRMPMDGRAWWALAEISRLVSDYEDVFLQGSAATELAGVEQAEEPDFAIKRHGKTALVLLMNQRRSEKTYRITLKPGTVQSAKRYYGGGEFDPTARVEIVLPAGDAEAIVLTLAP